MCLEYKLLCILRLRGEFGYFPWVSVDFPWIWLLGVQLVKLCLHGRVRVREFSVTCHQRTEDTESIVLRTKERNGRWWVDGKEQCFQWMGGKERCAEEGLA